jgi:oligopeptide transport system ATP-binding protein
MTEYSHLVVDGLRVSFRGGGRELPAVRDVSFELARGEALGIVGESGSGKSVTASAIMGLLDPEHTTVDARRLTLGGTDILGKGPREVERPDGGQRIAMIYQNPFTALNPAFRIGAALTEILRKRRGFDKDAAAAEALRLLEAVRIPSAKRRLREYPHQLSGGMQQRVVIAMALALNPEILIADEPTTALDVTVQAQILALLDDLRRAEGMGMIFISHDLGVVADVVDRVAVMYAGKIVETGAVDGIFDHPAHPYTVGLMDSSPDLYEKVHRLKSIPGAAPPIANQPSGCAFHPRCGRATEVCSTDQPELRRTEAGSDVACHHALTVVEGARR